MPDSICVVPVSLAILSVLERYNKANVTCVATVAGGVIVSIGAIIANIIK